MKKINNGSIIEINELVHDLSDKINGQVQYFSKIVK